MIQEDLERIRKEAQERMSRAFSPEDINQIKVNILGKKGQLTGILKSMKDVAPEDRPKIGQMVNETRARIEAALEDAQRSLEARLLEERLPFPPKRLSADTAIPTVSHSGKSRMSSSAWGMRLWKVPRSRRTTTTSRL